MTKYEKTFPQDCPNCGGELIVITECDSEDDYFCDGDVFWLQD